MKLIKQTALWNNDGIADKVYEIDLCEVAPDHHVVNFRFGRRGSTLKEGTKTASPVALAQAEMIFQKLVEEKRKGGYRATDHYVAPAENTPVQDSTVQHTNNDKQAYLLQCLHTAIQPITGKGAEKWPLARIIWRAGELGIAAAAPMIIPQLTKGDALHQYTACWSLGRCGNTIAIAQLEQVYASKATAPFVKRMAVAALLQLKKSNHSDSALLQTLLYSLPLELQSYLQKNEVANVQAQLGLLSVNPATLQHITTVYLLSEKYPAAASAIYEWLQHIAFAPNNFKAVRHIFKLAEFREDVPVFSLLAYRFEQTAGLFAYNRYDRNGYVYYNGKSYRHAMDEVKKEAAGLAYSDTTREYFTRRVWRTMRTLGKDGNETYIRYALGILLHYNSGLDGEPKSEERVNSFYWYNEASRSYETYTVAKTFTAFPNSHLLNYILYLNSSRYFRKRNSKSWQLQPSGSNEQLPREEAFPELWDKYPEGPVQLLFDSQVEAVHNFAVKIISSRSDVDELFDITALKRLLQKPFAATARLALRLAENRYNAAAPDEELVTALLLHPVAEARATAIKWIAENLYYFFGRTQIPVSAIINPYDDVFDVAGRWLSQQTPVATAAETISNNVIEQLLAMPENMHLATEAAAHAAQLLATYFLSSLAQLPVAVPARLIVHPLTPVQVLGAIILLHHPVQPHLFPDGLLSAMIQSENQQLREAGIILFGRLPESQLLQNTELIAAFCVSFYAEIRNAIQPIVKKLNGKNNEFGEALLYDLLPYMQRRETTEGLHLNLYQLFTNVLNDHLGSIDETTALAFVHSRFSYPQLLGLYILQNSNKADQFSVRQWIRMANHEVLAIRQFSWQLYHQHIQRIQAEAVESLRILDSSWADSRAFAFDYFSRNFTEENWTPELLVSVCDSTRDDVQAFGRQMITRYFTKENGELYLLQLSQHPAQQVQHFTTYYLQQFAADKPFNIEKLEAYFITVLSSVNKAGIAKKRIFGFLQEEALKSASVAQMAARIMARQSATMAVADKAACIAIMYNLQKRYPDITMPLSVVPVETYQKS